MTLYCNIHLNQHRNFESQYIKIIYAYSKHLTNTHIKSFTALILRFKKRVWITNNKMDNCFSDWLGKHLWTKFVNLLWNMKRSMRAGYLCSWRIKREMYKQTWPYKIIIFDKSWNAARKTFPKNFDQFFSRILHIHMPLLLLHPFWFWVHNYINKSYILYRWYSLMYPKNIIKILNI